MKKIGYVLTPASEEDIETLERFSNAIYEVDIKNIDTRTIQQNKALHLYCAMIAKTLNAEGLFMQGIFGSKIDMTPNLVKEQIIRVTMIKIFNIQSTTKLMRKDFDKLIDYITEAFASKGVSIPPFPSRELFDDK